MEVAADAGFGRTLFDTPRRWSIHRSYRNLGLSHGLDHGWKRFSDLAGKAEAWAPSVGKRQDGSGRKCGRGERKSGEIPTENGIDNMIG